MNEVLKKVKVFSESREAVKELSKLKEDKPKKELSSLESMETKVQTKPQEPVAIGVEQEHTVGIEVSVIEHKDFLGLEHVEECHELSITNLSMLATTLACHHDMPLNDNKEWISSTRHYGINFITSVRGGNGHFRWGQDPNMHAKRDLAVPNNKWKSTTSVKFIRKM